MASTPDGNGSTIPRVSTPPPMEGATPQSPSQFYSSSRVPIEEQRWSAHPKNLPYLGSVNSAVNDTSVNYPERFEQFTLGPGEKKVEAAIDTRTPNTSVFTFNKEDHTLANLLRAKLLKNSHVTFSAYKVPHPLFAKFELRVQTDGQITPKEALLATCEDLVRELGQLEQEFSKAFELTKMVGGQNGA